MLERQKPSSSFLGNVFSAFSFLIFDIFPSFLTGSAESIVNFRSDNAGSMPIAQ